jgi:hypothetical protein
MVKGLQAGLQEDMLQMWRPQQNVSNARTSSICPIPHQQKLFEDAARTPLSVVDQNQQPRSIAGWLGHKELLDGSTDSRAYLRFDRDIQFGYKALIQLPGASQGRPMQQH